MNKPYFTIEINCEIYQDQDGNPYRFNSLNEASEFAKDLDLKDTDELIITRQQ